MTYIFDGNNIINKSTGGPAKYGFKIVHKSETVNGKLLIHKVIEPEPAELEVIKLMQKQHKSGKSPHKIATL